MTAVATLDNTPPLCYFDTAMIEARKQSVVPSGTGQVPEAKGVSAEAKSLFPE